MSTISQREARRLRRRVEELERDEDARRNRWRLEYPGGTSIASLKVEAGSVVQTAVNTSRLLKHAVVVTCDDIGTLRFFALPLSKANR